MPIVVLDGPDGCGKTTLAKAICDKTYLKTRVIHLTYRWPKKMHLYHWSAIRQAIKYSERGELVVIDRWWPSEEIYAKVYRGGTKWPYFSNNLDRIAIRHGVLYVICTRINRETQMMKFAKLKKERAEMYEANEQIGQLHDEYNFLLQRKRHFERRPDWMHYIVDLHEGDVSCNTYAWKIRQTVDKLHLEQNRWFGLERVGNLNADYIFIGDIPNPPNARSTTPWVSYKNSALNMAEAVAKAGVSEWQCMWANVHTGAANEEFHKAQLKMFLFTRDKTKRIIALGREASDWLSRFDIEHRRMDHPAYIQRFRGRDIIVPTVKEVLA